VSTGFGLHSNGCHGCHELASAFRTHRHGGRLLLKGTSLLLGQSCKHVQQLSSVFVALKDA